MSDLSPVVVTSVQPLGLDQLQSIVDLLRGQFGLDAWPDVNIAQRLGVSYE
jgi:hypothetical protein